MKTRKKKAERRDSSCSVADSAKLLSLNKQADVLRLVTEGKSIAYIMQALQMERGSVISILNQGLTQYYCQHESQIQQYLAVANARYDRVLRTWFPRAEEQVIKDENGNEKVIPPDPQAAKIVLKVLADANKMLGLNKSRLQIEHTGVNGGPIEVNFNLKKAIADASDEQLEAFQKTRDPDVLRPFFRGRPALGSGTGTSTSQEETSFASTNDD